MNRIAFKPALHCAALAATLTLGLAGSALADVSLLPVAGINVYDIIKSDKLVLTTAAIKAIEARLGGAA